MLLRVALPLLLYALGTAPAAAQNVMLLIGDDMGLDRVGAYGAHPDAGPTPVLDLMAEHGVLFRNCWSNPVCSPTRATMLTGRYGFRTGIGNSVKYTDPDSFPLPYAETTLPEILPRHYSSGAVGKWHLGNEAVGGLLHPLLTGFDTHRGAIANLPSADGEDAYFEWEKSVDGLASTSFVYATTDTVDDALALTEELPEPWFLWVAFNAPHTPYHKPPPELHTLTLPQAPADFSPALHHRAMTQAMDAEIGRLVSGMRPSVLADTTLIFVGDNGTPGNATTLPFFPTHAKGTVYDGGVHVPLLVVGPDVRAPGSECTALVNTTDLFATVAELTGATIPVRTDSVSIVPYLRDPTRPGLRRWIYAERFKPNGFGPFNEHRRAVRDERYKLVVEVFSVADPTTRFHDLWSDPTETVNLLNGTLTAAQQVHYDRLDALLASLR